MKRKFLRGLYCVALMFVTIGAICLIPTFKSGVKTAGAETTQATAMADKPITSQFADGTTSAPDFGTPKTYPDGVFYQIDSKEKLAYVAYMIGVQDDEAEAETWASRNYELTVDLNLSDSLWTPIGSSAHPFKGIFHGNRHTISGLKVSESSAINSTYAGLFGYTAGNGDTYAQITDLVLNSFTYVPGGNATLNAGTLIGYAGANTIVANVYDERGDKGTYATIGGVQGSSVYIYRGGSVNGTTAKYTSAEEILDTVTVKNGIATDGYAISYKMNGGKAYKCTSTSTYDKSISYPIYGSVITTTGSAGVSYGNYGTTLISRADAMKAGEGYFAVKEGYAFTPFTTNVDDLIAAGMIRNLSWTEKNYNVTVNYGYGHELSDPTVKPRTMTITVGNDYSWAEAIPTDRYIEGSSYYSTYRRLGYTFKSRSFDEEATIPVAGYVGDEAGLSAGAYTMYLQWNALTENAYSVDFVNGANDTGFAPENAVREIKFFEDGTELVEGTASEGDTTPKYAQGTTADYDMSNHNSSKTVTFKFLLNAGYEFPKSTEGVVNTISTSDDIADPGVYLLFNDDSYDKYNETNYTIATEVIEGNTWIVVTVNDIVGGGTIALAFERTVYDIALEGTDVTWSISDLKNAKQETTDTYTILTKKDNKDIIQTRVGETFNVKATANANKYIVNWSASKGFPSQEGENGTPVLVDKITEGENANAVTIGTQVYYTELTYIINNYANTLTAENNEHSIVVTAVPLKVNVGVAITHDATDEYKALAGVTNTGAGVDTISTTGEEFVNFVAGFENTNGKVTVFMYTNAYYRYKSLSVKRIVTGKEPETIATTGPVDSILQTEGDYKGYYKQTYTFDAKIGDNEFDSTQVGDEFAGFPRYEVMFTVEPAIYEVDYAIQVSFDGGKTFDTLNKDNEEHQKLLTRWFSEYTTSKASGKYGDSTEFKFVLTSGENGMGAKELLSAGIEVTRADGITNEAEQVGQIGSINAENTAYNFGTTNSVVTAKFILKNPKFELSTYTETDSNIQKSEGYVLDVNGSLNRNITFADAAITFNGSETAKVTETGVTRTIALEDARIPMAINNDVISIDIPTGYYFVGWYLKNGDVYTMLTSDAVVSLSALTTNATIVNALHASSDAVTSFQIVPAIKQKTVTLKFETSDNALESYTTKGETASNREVVYYHEQENARYNQLEESSALIKEAFKFNSVSDLVQKVASRQKGWVSTFGADALSGTHEFNIVDATFTTLNVDLTYGNIWGGANNTDITFLPTWDLVKYVISIDGEKTIAIYMGDTISFVAGQPGETGKENENGVEGGVKYIVTRPDTDNTTTSVETAGVAGKTVTGFDFKGNGATENVTTTFTIDETNIERFLVQSLYYPATDPTEKAFDIVSIRVNNEYKLYIQTTAGEELDTTSGVIVDGVNKYVKVVYSEDPTALAGVKITRKGYKLASWVDANVEGITFATADVANSLVYNAYNYNSDKYARVIWERDNGGYINVATNVESDITYNGVKQAVATATLSTLGGDTNLANDVDLPNGDTIKEQYWVRAEDKDKDTKTTYRNTVLELTNVADSGSYVYVVKYHDNINNKDYVTESSPVTITIKANQVAVTDWNLNSYYTGTQTFVATDANAYGTITLAKGFDALSEEDKARVSAMFSFDKVEVVDSNGWNADSYTSARYYFALSDEIAANFTGLNKVEDGKYYILLNDADKTGKIQIVATPVTVSVSGTGFFIGEGIDHTVKAEFTAGSVASIDDFTFEGRVLTGLLNETAKHGAVGVYNAFNQFNFEFVTVKFGDKVVYSKDNNANFVFTIDGQYEIEEVTSSNAWVYNYEIGYLTASNKALNSVENSYVGESISRKLKVSGITVGGVDVNIDYNSSFVNYVNESGDAIFTLYGNGTTGFTFIIRNTASVKFNVQVLEDAGSELAFLGYNAKASDVADYASAFTTPVANNPVEVTAGSGVVSGKAEYYALYTDVKQIILDYKKKATEQDDDIIYVTAGQAENIADITWDGFKFENWTSNNTSVSTAKASTSGYDVTAQKGSTYVSARLSANWSLEAPEIVKTSDDVVISGKTVDPAIKAGSLAISVSDIISSITKQNTTDIEYTYSWSGEGISAPDGETLTIANPTTALNNKVYTLKVTARARLTNESKYSEVTFKINLSTLELTLGNETIELTYNGKTRNNEINVKYFIDGVEQTGVLNLADYLASNGNVSAGKNFGFTLMYKALGATGEGVAVSEIKNAGVYTIGLVVNGEIYKTSTSTATVTVAKASYNITDADNVSFSKPYGSPDPASMTKEITINETDNLKVVVTFVRAGAETAQGSYALIVSSWTNSDNVNITYQDSNTWFEITEPQSKLYIDIKSELSRIYDGKTATNVEVKKVDGTWKIVIEDAEGNGLASSEVGVAFLPEGSDVYQDITGDAIADAIKGARFSIDSAKDVTAHGYTITATGVKGTDGFTFDGIEFRGSVQPVYMINARKVIVEGVEKTFDTNATFTSETDNVTIKATDATTGVVAGESIIVTGTFAKETVDTDINVTFNAIANANYEIDLTASVNMGEIKVSGANITVTQTNKEFTYGNSLKSTMSIADVIAKLGLSVEVDGNTADAKYINISAITIDASNYSTSGNLKYDAAEQTYALTLSSDNYSDINGKTVKITVNQKALSILANTVPTREYDGTTTVPTFAWALEGVETNDIVNVDSSSAVFNGNDVGDHAVTGLKLEETGDYANYDFDATASGKITELTIKFQITFPDFASIAGDGEPNLTTIKSTAVYSGLANKQAVLDAITGAGSSASRKGFTFDKYTFGAEQELNSANFADFLASAVTANAGEGIEIKSNWNRDSYSLNATITNGTYTLYTVANDGTETETTETSFLYNTKLRLKVTGNSGYKFKGASLTAGTSNLEVLGQGKRENGTVTFNIMDATSLKVEFEDIIVTVKVNANKPDDANVVISGDTTATTHTYSDLMNSTAKSMLDARNISATANTFTLTGWTYGEDVALGEETFKTLLGELDENAEITFKAVWTGEEYKVVFNATEGEFTDAEIANITGNGGTVSTDKKSAEFTGTYGEVMTFFPTPELAGKICTWFTEEDGKGDRYIVNTTKIHNVSADKTLNLYAHWTNKEFELTIEFGANIKDVKLNGNSISSGDKTTLLFPNGVEIAVTTAEGYSFNATLLNANDGDIKIENGKITVSRLAAQSTLTITATANENTLTVTGVNATIDGDDTAVIKAFTATTAEVEFTANEGYEFVEGALNIVYGGKEYDTVISNNGKTLTFTWKGFTGNETLKVTATPIVNKITFADCSDKVTSIVVGNMAIATDGTGFATAPTGETLTAMVTLEYGYKDATIAGYTSLEKFADGVYSYEFTIAGFNGDLNLQINAVAREYNINLTIDAPADASATDVTATVTPNEDVAFGSDITLQAEVNSKKFLFAGWYIGEVEISKNIRDTLKLTKALREQLENETNTLEVVAKFTYSIDEVAITLNGRGSANYKVNNGEEIHVSGAGKVKLDMQSEFSMTLLPETGYKVASVEFTDVNGDTITDYDWFNAENNTINIDFKETSVPLKAIVVTFIAGPAKVNVITGIELNNQVIEGDTTGGSITWTDENGKPQAGGTGASFTVDTVTGAKLYFLVHTNEGYTLSFRTGEGEKVNINRVKSDVFSGDNALYEVSGFAGEITLKAVFAAKENVVTVRFIAVDDERETEVYAGEIAVKTEGSNVVVSGNNSSKVDVSALTNGEFEMTVYTNFSYTFLRGAHGLDYNTTGSLGVSAGEIITALNAQKGYTESVTIKVSAIAQNSTIDIKVKAKEYSINFINGTQSMGRLENVRYGQEFTIVGNVVPEAKEGYTFNGYFTKQIGQGKQYVNNMGAAMGPWKENGYIWDGARYIVQEGFDGNSTFNLYASYSFDKQKLYLDIIPEALEETITNEKKISIADLVVSLATQTNWQSQEDLLYAEVLADASFTLNANAIKFEGYTFNSWEIYDAENMQLVVPVVYSADYTYSPRGRVTSGTLIIKAVYFANYEITLYNTHTEANDGDCGEAYIEQRGIACEGAYDTREYVTLVAKENAGYKFLGWKDVTNNVMLADELFTISYDNGVWKYTYKDYVINPLTLQAQYEGIEIDVVVENITLGGHGEVRSILVNGKSVSLVGGRFKARVGDVIGLEIVTQHGYGVKFGKLGFSEQAGIHSYKISGSDLEEMKLLRIVLEADPQPVNYTFELRVEGQTNSEELELAGYISYKNNGTEVKIDRNTVITTLYGSTIYIDVNAFANYKLGYVKLLVNGVEYDITNYYQDAQKQIILSTDILSQHNAGSDARIIVSFARMLWTDYRSQTIAGEGTDNNPYKITSAEDMAFVAYAVNNGLVNETSGAPYKDAVYTVTKDLDFTGKYWVPIGTNENPFNGVINFGTHWFTGITHFTEYTPSTVHEGLIWYKTSRAQINKATSNTLVIALSVAGGVVALALILLLIILLVKRAKKKKMEELANS